MTTCFCTNLRLATRRLTAVYDAALAPVGINIGQYFLLRKIRDRRSVSLTELGQLAELERSTVGRNARVLERMGLVVTARGESDQREALVSLTPAGHTLLKDAQPLWEGAQGATASRLGMANLSTLQTVLEAI
ncbi:MarR family winged helix-turn-helix transcriptional regulator [Lichenifustis flavocetrariae]|uniref:Winged helix DNA-binding protein n=1 Tax=Lichenifustis flavocetrariae TaxID=2949735 RepID=A0AA41YV80_9HYPH|nr:winged helix DNA-binding protein [Lichenifustis flavocetrariae]MCW6509209.1 winged helix DNA-binding protein [Lichenifustis flavocetrariae]